LRLGRQAAQSKKGEQEGPGARARRARSKSKKAGESSVKSKKNIRFGKNLGM
jgi:hypothetical protein